jgi:exonuclease SbcC
MKPCSLKATNFLSFKELEYNYVDNPVLIKGENLTEIDSQKSNGSGKSAIENAEMFALLGVSTAGKDTLDRDLIHWGEEQASVSMEIVCPIRKETLCITRTIFLKKSSTLEISINGEPASFSTVRDGNAFILEWLAISAEDLKNYYIISHGNYTSFFTSGNVDKMKLISRFSNFSSIDKTSAAIKKDIEALNEIKAEVEQRMNKKLGEKEVYERQLAEEQERDLEEEYNTKREALLKQVEQYEAKEVESKNSIKEKKQKIEECKSLMREVLTKGKTITEEIDKAKVDYTEIYKAIDEEVGKIKIEKSEHEKSKAKLTATIESIEGKLAVLRTKLMGVIACPACGHKFLPGENTDELSLKKEKDEFEKEVDEYAVKLKDEKESIKEIDGVISTFEQERQSTQQEEEEHLIAIRKLQTQLHSINLQAKELESNIKIEEGSILGLEQKIKESQENCLNLKETIRKMDETGIDGNTAKIEELENSIKLAQVSANKESKELDKINTQIFNTTQWITRFKEFKLFLAVEQLEVIQGYANKFLRAMGTDLRVKLEGYKALKDGTVKEEITAYIVRDGLKKFWSFSGGERCRLEIAMMLTIQEMINSTNPYGGLHFLHIDEVTEGIDALGLSLILESLTEFKFPILITTHVTEVVYPEVLTIVKENGISRIL